MAGMGLPSASSSSGKPERSERRDPMIHAVSFTVEGAAQNEEHSFAPFAHCRLVTAWIPGSARRPSACSALG